MTTTEKILGYDVTFTPDPEAGGYVAICEALPGCATQGETMEEARTMAADAIQGWLACGDPFSLEGEINRILYCNDSAAIAKGLIDLLLRATKPDFILDDALALLYPKIDHCDLSRAQYVAERSAQNASQVNT